jgi:hypothetical protein
MRGQMPSGSFPSIPNPHVRLRMSGTCLRWAQRLHSSGFARSGRSFQQRQLFLRVATTCSENLSSNLPRGMLARFFNVFARVHVFSRSGEEWIFLSGRRVLLCDRMLVFPLLAAAARINIFVFHAMVLCGATSLPHVNSSLVPADV